MRKYIFKNKIFFKIMIAFVLIGFLGAAYNVNASVNKPELNITASTNKPSIYVNEEFEVTYKIDPQPLIASDINKKVNKEIILVVDTSGSMDEYISYSETRIQALRTAAKTFIDKFKNDTTTKIGIVSYDFNGKISQELISATNQDTLISKINKLDADGATNIGDGIRVAHNMLSKDAAVKKYIVLMSDGIPTALTYSGEAGGYYGNRYYTESFYKSPKTYKWETYFQKSSKWNYYTDLINNDNLKYGTYGNSDPQNYCLDYSTIMAGKLKNAGITNYVIGFSGSSDSTRLNKIATAGGGSYYDARNSAAINQVYSEIGDKIKADYSVENVKLKFTLPDGLEYVADNFDTISEGNNYEKSIPSIAYKLNSSTEYVAEPFNINLKFKGIKKNTYELCGDKWNLSYKDVGGNIVTKPLPKVTINVEKYNAEFKVVRKSIPEENEGKFNLNKEFDIQYTISPDPIKIQSNEKQKEIVLVVDTSGSMDYSVDQDKKVYGKPSRLDLTKSALNNFINKFGDLKNVKIGLVTYSYRGNVFMNTNDYFFESNNIQKIKDKVNTLSADGGTNLGDGLRKALWMLSNNKDSKKYVVLMTDGTPTFYSYYGSYYNRNYYTEIDNKNVDYNEGNDYNKGLEYSNIMAKILKENQDLNLKTFAIGFSKGANANTLKEIAANAAGTFLDATSSNENAINEVYSNIAEQIKTDLALENVKFTQSLPDGLVFSETNGQSITKDLKINYTYKDGEYKADPITFTVKVKGTKADKYVLENDAVFSYKDLDGTDMKKAFDPLTVNILGDFTIKQGMFQRGGGSQSNTDLGKGNIKYIPEGTSMSIVPNMEYQLAALIKTSGQETPMSIMLNHGQNEKVTEIKVTAVNIFAINTDGSLGAVPSASYTIKNDGTNSPTIDVILQSENTPGDKYYIVNYNYVVTKAEVNEKDENSSIPIINKAGIINTTKIDELKLNIVAMPDVF